MLERARRAFHIEGEWIVDGTVKRLVQVERAWRGADGRGHSGARTRVGAPVPGTVTVPKAGS